MKVLKTWEKWMIYAAPLLEKWTTSFLRPREGQNPSLFNFESSSSQEKQTSAYQHLFKSQSSFVPVTDEPEDQRKESSHQFENQEKNFEKENNFLEKRRHLDEEEEEEEEDIDGVPI